MKKIKTQKGIALILLLLILLIILVVALVILNIKNKEGMSNSKNVLSEYDAEEKIDNNKNNVLNEYNQERENEVITLKDAQKNTMLTKTTNSITYDEYGNRIVVPAGFKIFVDSTTNNADNVTEGVVIEDSSGNQFVWVPVGIIYTSADKSTSEKITLGRYLWDGSTGLLMQPTTNNLYTSEIEIEWLSNTYTEYQSTSRTDNAKARNIKDFCESTIKNGGYYIGRYEAGDSSTTTIEQRTGNYGASTEGTLVCKANQVPYNWILQSDASSKCQNMYADGYSRGTFSSDLVNSYAWDTAIIFIQTFGKEKAKSYSILNQGTKGFLKTGENKDEHCNINDMSGNAYEWTTETSSKAKYPCVTRGGYYHLNYGKPFGNTYDKGFGDTASTSYAGAFRPLLYIAL